MHLNRFGFYCNYIIYKSQGFRGNGQECIGGHADIYGVYTNLTIIGAK